MPIEAESPEELGYDTIQYNLAESALRDRTFGELNINCNELVLAYGDHRGYEPLRQLLSHEYDVAPTNVITTPGAAGALFLTALSNLGKQDTITVMHPNYMTNIVTPRIIGCQIKHIHIEPCTTPWISAERVISAIHPNSRMVSITLPHNPTGYSMTEAELIKVVNYTGMRNMILLVDETYRELHYSHQLPVATKLGNHVVSVSAMSKSYGVPGIRLGWVASNNTAIMENILAAKEQSIITTSILDEYLAFKLLEQKDTWLRPTIKEIEKKRSLTDNYIDKHPLLSWSKPEGGVVGVVRIQSNDGFEPKTFYSNLYNQHQTYVGPGHWFELEEHYFRLGFGYPTIEELAKGLENISECLK